MIVRAMWVALGLELPVRRRSHLMRFFVGFKPLSAAAYASLLRAMARASIERGLIPVRRDSQYDPVELIAAAVAVSIDQWDRECIDSASIGPHDGLWYDLATRTAAFETLFRVRARGEGWQAACLALAGVSGGSGAEPVIDSVFRVLARARLEIIDVLKRSKSMQADAVLAEIVVMGAGFSRAPQVNGGTATKALPFARGLTLVRVKRIGEALAVFEEILHRVPGHTLALQQAARCCVECGAPSQAELYTRRASGGDRRRLDAVGRGARSTPAAEARQVGARRFLRTFDV